MTAAAASSGAQAQAPFDEKSAALAQTYAHALVNAAVKAGNADEVLDELDAIRDFVAGKFPAFALMMNSPLRSTADKDQLLVKAFEGRALASSVNFLRVLNRHGRLAILGAILHAARETWERQQNRRRVSVRSAVPLSTAEQDALRDRLAGALAATPILAVTVDPSLIGGLVVQVGDVVYDGSVRNRLAQLRNRLIEGKAHEIQSRRDHFRHSE